MSLTLLPDKISASRVKYQIYLNISEAQPNLSFSSGVDLKVLRRKFIRHFPRPVFAPLGANCSPAASGVESLRQRSGAEARGSLLPSSLFPLPSSLTAPCALLSTCEIRG